MNEEKAVLKEFGLTDNEAEVYLTLLSLGSASATDILMKTSIHRINLYDILERLQEKGLISYVLMGKRKHYEAVEPKRILEIEEERKKRIEQIIPNLQAQRLLSKSPQEATIFKDRKGLRNVIDEVPNAKGEILLFASGWGFRENFPDYYNIWYGRLKQKKVKMKTLVSNNFRGNSMPHVSQYRYLPSQYIFPSTTIIYDDKLLMIMWSAQPIGILIRGKKISSSYRKFFEMLWKMARA